MLDTPTLGGTCHPVEYHLGRNGVAPFARSAEEEIGGETIRRGHVAFGGCSASSLAQQAKSGKARAFLDQLIAFRTPALGSVSEQRDQREVSKRSHLSSPDREPIEPIDEDRTPEDSIQESCVNSAIDRVLARAASVLYPEEPATGWQDGWPKGRSICSRVERAAMRAAPSVPDSFRRERDELSMPTGQFTVV